MARAHAAAIEEVLHRRVDVDALSAPRDLHAVRQGGDGAVRPAAAAVLWDVLIARHAAVVHAVLVAPVEAVGELGPTQAQPVVRALRGRVPPPDDAELFDFLAAQQLAAPAAWLLALEDARGEGRGVLLREAAAGHRRRGAPRARRVRRAVRLRLVLALASIVLGGGPGQDGRHSDRPQHLGGVLRRRGAGELQMARAERA
mmetsp:Transcript_79550/g.223134  ORF Transcript_79550/g.223134 Transcript_79550/m.223134 type:complete len:201 (+) Transcript_79550:834-1436(+)